MSNDIHLIIGHVFTVPARQSSSGLELFPWPHLQVHLLSVSDLRILLVPMLFLLQA